MGMSKNLMLAAFPEDDDEDGFDDFLEEGQADEGTRFHHQPYKVNELVPF